MFISTEMMFLTGAFGCGSIAWCKPTAFLLKRKMCVQHKDPKDSEAHPMYVAGRTEIQ